MSVDYVFDDDGQPIHPDEFFAPLAKRIADEIDRRIVERLLWEAAIDRQVEIVLEQELEFNDLPPELDC